MGNCNLVCSLQFAKLQLRGWGLEGSRERLNMKLNIERWEGLEGVGGGNHVQNILCEKLNKFIKHLLVMRGESPM